MTFEEALELLKVHYNWQVKATGINPSGGRFALIVENERMHRFSEKYILSMVADFQENLFEGAK